MDFNIPAVRSQQYTEMADVWLRFEPVVQDHASVGFEQSCQQLGRLFCLKRHSRQALPAGVHREAMRSGGLNSGTDFLGHSLPDIPLVTRESE